MRKMKTCFRRRSVSMQMNVDLQSFCFEQLFFTLGERLLSSRRRDPSDTRSLKGKEMKELFQVLPDRQIFDLIRTDGVEYLGSIKLRVRFLSFMKRRCLFQEGVAMKGFGNEKIIWEVHEQGTDAPWDQIWQKRLEPARASTAFGSTSVIIAS